MESYIEMQEAQANQLEVQARSVIICEFVMVSAKGICTLFKITMPKTVPAAT